MARDDKYATGSDTDYSANPFKNADSPAVSKEKDADVDSINGNQDSLEEQESDASASESSTQSDDRHALEMVTRKGVPYAMARTKVTDDRQQKQFQLLKETRFELQDAVAELVKQYDDENLSETDALEIILRAGLAHAEDYDAAANSLGFGLENIQFSFSE